MLLALEHIQFLYALPNLIGGLRLHKRAVMMGLEK